GESPCRPRRSHRARARARRPPPRSPRATGSRSAHDMSLQCKTDMDRGLVYSAAFLRSLGTSTVGILIGIYFARLHLNPQQMGFVWSAGLAGNVLVALLATVGGDRLG